MKHVSKLKTESTAYVILEQDLSDLDPSQFLPAQFEILDKDSKTNMFLPLKLLDAVKTTAKNSGVPYRRFIREALEQAVGKKRE